MIDKYIIIYEAVKGSQDLALEDSYFANPILLLLLYDSDELVTSI